MQIKGLDDLARKMEELEKAMAKLDGDITQVNFNPHDPESIQLAIQKVSDAIDERVSRYAHNDMVTSVASELKEKYRDGILERAAQARLDENENET